MWESRFQPVRLLPPVFLIFMLVLPSFYLHPQPWHHLSTSTKAVLAGATVVYVALMLAMRRRSYLRMGQRGIEVRLLGVPRFYAWSDIERVQIMRKRLFFIPMFSFIQLKLREGARLTKTVRHVAGPLSGYEATFPAWFDKSAIEISKRIESMQRQYRAS